MHRLAAVLFVLSASVVAAQDSEENPEYTSWAKVKKGTTVTLTTSLFEPLDRGVSGTNATTYKLVEVKADVLVLEARTVYTRQGKITSEPKPHPVQVPRLLRAGATGLDLMRPKGAKVGSGVEEVVKIGKVEFKTVRYTGEYMDNSFNPVTRTDWLSADVPGCLVKRDHRIGGKGAFHSVTEFKWVTKP